MRFLAKQPPKICVKSTSRSGPNANSRGRKNVHFGATEEKNVTVHVIFSSFVPWTKIFGYKVTFFGHKVTFFGLLGF